MLRRLRSFNGSPTTAVVVPAFVVAVAALEVWVLTLPFLADWPVALPAGWNAREASILLDLILVLPAMAALLLWVWSQPRFVTAGPKLPRWLRPWIKPQRLLYLLIPYALAQLSAPDLGLGHILAGIAGLAIIGEIVAFGILAVKLTQLSRVTRQARLHGYSFTTALAVGLERTFGASQLVPAMGLVTFELAQIYHFTIGWFARRPSGARTFTYHRHRDETLWFGLTLMIVIEAVPIHVVVHHYSTVAAWILTGLHAYSLLWTLGLLVSVRQRPHVLRGTRLRLSTGLFSEAVVELSNVREVIDARGEEAEPTEEDEQVGKFGSRHDVTLELHEPVRVHELFGGGEEVSIIHIGLDAPDEFLEALRPHV